MLSPYLQVDFDCHGEKQLAVMYLPNNVGESKQLWIDGSQKNYFSEDLFVLGADVMDWPCTLPYGLYTIGLSA